MPTSPAESQHRVATDLRVEADTSLASLVDVARGAQLAWSRSESARRRSALDGLRARLVNGHDDLCELQSAATGETLVDVAVGDIEPLLSLLHALPAECARASSGAGKWSRLRGLPQVRRVPVGVVGLALGRPARLLDLLAPAATALCAGNAVVLATTARADRLAEVCVELLRERLSVVGADPALVSLVLDVDRPEVVLEGAGVDVVWQPASPQASGLSMWVAADADLAVAEVRAMGGAFASAGRARLPIRRVYADGELYPALLARLANAVSSLRLGPAQGPRVVDCAEAAQPSDLARVDELLGDAIARGARILVGGDRVESLGARFYRPTLLVDVEPSMRIAREPFEGPVLSLMRRGLRPPTGRAARLEIDARGARMELADPERAGWALGALAVPEALRACTRAQVYLDDPSLPAGRSYPVRRTSYPMLRELAGLWHGEGARSRLGHAWGAVRLLAEERLLRDSELL